MSESCWICTEKCFTSPSGEVFPFAIGNHSMGEYITPPKGMRIGLVDCFVGRREQIDVAVSMCAIANDKDREFQKRLASATPKRFSNAGVNGHLISYLAEVKRAVPDSYADDVQFLIDVIRDLQAGRLVLALPKSEKE